MPPQVCIIGARRTPFGRFLGGLARRSALELAVHAGRAALGPARPEEVDLVVLGNVLSAGQGMNLARQAGVALGLPLATPAAKPKNLRPNWLKQPVKRAAKKKPKQ